MKKLNHYMVSVGALYRYIKAMDPARIKEISNGCGSKEGFFGLDIVPDNFLGLDLTDVCNRHDVSYHLGTTAEEKLAGDLMFLNDMVLKNIGDEGQSDKIKALRFKIIMDYFIAVHFYGDDAFFPKETA